MTEYIHYWHGKPMSELPRKELLVVIDFLGEELRRLNLTGARLDRELILREQLKTVTEKE